MIRNVTDKKVAGRFLLLPSLHQPSRFHGDAVVLFSCYFPAESVHQFAQGLLKPGELLAQATVSTPANAAQAGKPPAGEPVPPAVKGDGRK